MIDTIEDLLYLTLELPGMRGFLHVQEEILNLLLNIKPPPEDC
jgi:hypothetical protein